MSAPILLDFHDQPSANKALKKVAQLMLRAGQPVVSTSFEPKIRRTSSVSYREALLTLASGQTVTMRVTQSGDVFQVLLNGSIKPIKNAADHVRAIAEIAKLAEVNQAAFQKKQARVAVEMPKGIRTAAPTMQAKLETRITELDAQIAERQQQVGELQAELGDQVLDAVGSGPIKWDDGQYYARDQFDMVPTDEHGEMPPARVLKAGAVPVVPALDAAELDEALTLAKSVQSGSVLDSADLAAAVSTLRIALDVVETNSVINMGEGNIEQAELEQANAESFRAALGILDGADPEVPEPPELPEPEEPTPSKVGEPARKANAEFMFPEDGSAALDNAGQPRDENGRFTSPNPGGGGGNSGAGGAPAGAPDAPAPSPEDEAARLRAELERQREASEGTGGGGPDIAGAAGTAAAGAAQLDPVLAAAKDLGELVAPVIGALKK